MKDRVLQKVKTYSFVIILILIMSACSSSNEINTANSYTEFKFSESNILTEPTTSHTLDNSSTKNITEGIYRITNKSTKRALNMQLSGMVDGSGVWQYAKTNMLDELWNVTKVPNSNYYTIESMLTKRSISIRKNSDKIGSLIEVRILENAPNAYEYWILNTDSGSVQIISPSSQLTLGLEEDSIKSTNLPKLLNYENFDSQLWDFEKIILPDNIPSLLPVDGALFHSSCPEIIKYNNTYYMYIMAPGISIKSSTDLIHWKHEGTVFGEHDPKWLKEEVPNYGIWAPGVYKILDTYYLYYSISTAGSQNSAIGLATNITLDPSSSEYQWIDQGMVIRSTTESPYNAIDPNIITDEYGDVWLTFGSYWNGLYQRQIDPNTGLLLESNPEFYHIAKRYGNNGAIEAPYIIKRNEYYYLFSAFNPMDNSYHNRVGRSTSVHGPFIDRDGKPMLEGGGSEVTQSLSEILMPGHASIFLDDDGTYYFVSEYFRTNSPSILLIGDIIWDEKGWPITALTPDISTYLQ